MNVLKKWWFWIVIVLVIIVVLVIYVFSRTIILDVPQDFPQPNYEAQEDFTKIVNEVINEQEQKGLEISIESLSLSGYGSYRFNGDIFLNCPEMNLETEEEIIKSIYDKIMNSKYADKFTKPQASSVDIHCNSELAWRILYGEYYLNGECDVSSDCEGKIDCEQPEDPLCFSNPYCGSNKICSCVQGCA